MAALAGFMSDLVRKLVTTQFIYDSDFGMFRQYSTRPEVGQSICLTDFGTRRIFSEEHDIFRQSVRRFFQEEVLPNHSK